MLHVLRAAPIPEGFHRSTTGDLAEMRDKARIDCQRQLEELALQNGPVDCNLKFMVKFGIASEQILLASHTLQAGLIVLGLNRSTHVETASHMPWDVTYKVVCGAHCPVLTIRH